MADMWKCIHGIVHVLKEKKTQMFALLVQVCSVYSFSSQFMSLQAICLLAKLQAICLLARVALSSPPFHFFSSSLNSKP